MHTLQTSSLSAQKDHAAAPPTQENKPPAEAASSGTSVVGNGNETPSTPRPVFQQLNRTAKYIYKRNDYIKRFAWEWVQRTCVRFSPRRAHGWRRFWLRLFGTTIPSTSGTKATTFILHPWLLTIGEHSMLGDRVAIYNPGPVFIGDHTVISQDSYICSGSHDYRKANLPAMLTTVKIGSGVWVCAGAFVGPSLTIGDNCVVGARAVVMGDIAPNMIASGNPAKALKPRKMDWDDNEGA